MKRLFTILVAVLMTASMWAQEQNRAYDVIYWQNKDTLQAKVLTVGEEEVSYKVWANMEGPTYSVDKLNIIAIHYANGMYDVFDNRYEAVTEEKQQTEKAPKQSAFFIGGTGAIGYDGAFTFALEPQFGYEFTDRWAIGTGVGVVVAAADRGGLAVMGIVEPFVRFCAWHNDLVYIDIKATAGVGFDNYLELCQVGLRPSLRFRLTEHCDLAADIGLFGAQYTPANDWQPALGITATAAGIWVAYRF